jgi:hypothetical protein
MSDILLGFICLLVFSYFIKNAIELFIAIKSGFVFEPCYFMSVVLHHEKGSSYYTSIKSSRNKLFRDIEAEMKQEILETFKENKYFSEVSGVEVLAFNRIN